MREHRVQPRLEDWEKREHRAQLIRQRGCRRVASPAAPWCL